MHLQLLAFTLPMLSIADQFQIPVVLPGSVYVPETSNLPTLADLLTIETSASIFFSYARETELSELFNGATKATVLVPTNKAVIALPRKPHQGPEHEEGIKMSEQEFHDLSKQNVEQWVSAHIVPQSPISLLSTYPTLLSNKSVSFELTNGDENAPEWTRVLVDGSIRVLGMRKALNGVLYLIDGDISLN